MLFFKSCPRFDDGDLTTHVDLYGEMVLCLQGGHYLSDADQVSMGLPVPSLELSIGPRRRRRRAAARAGWGRRDDQPSDRSTKCPASRSALTPDAFSDTGKCTGVQPSSCDW